MPPGTDFRESLSLAAGVILLRAGVQGAESDNSV